MEISIALSSIVLTGLGIWYCLEHGISHGIKYMLLHIKIHQSLSKAIYDSNIYTERIVLLKKCAVLPSIKIILDMNLSNGKILIENCIKLDKRLDEMPISSALPNTFVLVASYISGDCNDYVYEFEDANLEQLKFDSLDEFETYADQYGEYEIFLDAKHCIPLFHGLIIGQTGCGKSYCFYNFILQMIMKNIPYELYICDPKYSGLYTVGYRIDKTKVASDIDDIILILHKFHNRMQERKKEFAEKLLIKLDSDYRDFNLAPICLFIDEYSSFRASLGRYDKKTRDFVDETIGNIIREGRQLGCFCFIAQQQTNASNLGTELRENIPFKLILGMSERQTYMTALGEYPDVAKRKYMSGQGIFVYPQIATPDNPLITSIATLNFDILEAIDRIVASKN